MSIFFRRTERRAITFQDIWGRGDDPGLWTSQGAFSLVPLFAAHRTIIDAVAATPLHAYRKGASGTAVKMASQPALITAPPFRRSVFDWKAQCVGSMVSDGNAFGLVTSVGTDGWPTAVVWLDPSRVSLEADDAHVQPRWLLDGRSIDSESLIHIPWIVPPGRIRGISPLKAFMIAFEMGQAAQRVARDWFINGAMPSGHLKSTGLLSPAQADTTKKRWKAAIQGRDVFVSGNDWEFSPIGVPADEARFIETLRLSATQIASIYGIPAEEIGGDTGNSMTYATVEGNEMRFASRVIRPWAIRIEDRLSMLLPRPQYCRFNLDANVRADLMTRMQAQEIGQRAGILTNDEARRLEDRPPLTPAERADWLTLWRNPAGGAPTNGGD